MNSYTMYPEVFSCICGFTEIPTRMESHEFCPRCGRPRPYHRGCFDNGIPLRHFLLAALLFTSALSFGRAQSQVRPVGLPPARPFVKNTIKLSQLPGILDQSVALRSKDMSLDSRGYSDADSQIVSLLQMCSELSVPQMASVSRVIQRLHDGGPMYLPPNLNLLEDKKYRDCETNNMGKSFPGSAGNPEIVVITSVTANWDTQNRTWVGPKQEVRLYFKPTGAPPVKTLQEWGERFGILYADISDGSTPDTAPPPKSFDEMRQEARQQAKPRLVVGEYVCPGTVLHVKIRNDVFNTFVNMGNITVKTPARIGGIDGSGSWFQQLGAPYNYYQVVSGGGSRASCIQ
jgi:hypothetical protein